MKKFFLKRFPKVKPSIDGMGRKKTFFTSKRRKIFLALVLVVLTLVILQLPHPALRAIQKQTIMLLTSRETDWTPLLNQWAREGIWQDSFEKQVFKQTYRETMLLPVSGKVSRLFKAGEHPGVDIVAEEGSLVKVSLSGEVIPFSNGPSDNAVALKHDNNRVTIYAGLKNITVDIGQVVPQGKVLGVAKKTVHFEVRVKNIPVDPLPYLSANNQL